MSGRRLGVMAGLCLLLPGLALAGGTLKIFQVRSDGNYGDATYHIFPNGRNGCIDGGGSTAVPSAATVFMDAAIGNGGTLWYMVMSHAHTDHYYGLTSYLPRYVVMRYYSSFPENSPNPPGAAAYATFVNNLNTEFGNPYTASANCYEIIATGNPATTAKVSGPSTDTGPGWDPSVDALVVHGEELGNSTDPNINSVSYHIWYGSNTVETGGDSPNGPEVNMTTNYGGAGGRIYRNVQLFKAHHHGSNGANYDTWFNTIAPPDPIKRYIYNCTGDIASAHTLTAASATRIINSERTWYRTDLDGAAGFAANGDGNWATVRQYVYSEGGATTHVNPAAPPTIGTLSGAAAAPNANLSWTAAGGSAPVWYYIYRATVAGGIAVERQVGADPPVTFWRTGSVTGLYRRLTRVAATGTTHQDAAPGSGTFYYRIKADQANNYESEYSNEVSVVLGGGDTTAPAAPTGLAVADVAGDQGTALRLNWTANTEPDRKDYGVYRALVSGTLATKSLVTRVNSPGTTHQDAGLVANTTYYYQLTCRDTSLNESGGSTQVSAYPIDNLAPAAPTGLTVADVAADQGGALRLNWTANTETDRKDYRIRKSTGTGITAATAVLATVANPGTTHQEGGLVNNTSYYYRLTCRDTSNNESAISAADVGPTYPVDNLAPAEIGRAHV